MSLEDRHMNWKTPTVWMTLTLLVVGALAVPAMAQPDDRGRPDDPGSQADAHRHGGNRSADAGNESAHPRDHHRPAHERFAERCREALNETGELPERCERAKHAHDHAHQARRAAHGLMKAVDALEHRIVTLEKLEKKFGDKLEEGNLTANETAAFEAKLERIQDMQNATLERIEAMEERLDRIKDRWQDAREHVRDFRDKVVVCHVSEEDDDADGNSTANATGNVSYVTLEISRAAWPAHEAHGDSLGACEGDDESDAVDEDEFESDEEELGSAEEESEDESDDESDDEEDGSEEDDEESGE